MDLDLRDLRYFQIIAELGHLGRAADALGRSQPALTKCVRRLESALDAELFARKGRGIVLTQVGEMLLVRTRRLRVSADTVLREVQQFARGDAGRVRLGCGTTSAEHLLPAVCDLVLSKAAGITLEINVAMNYVLREQLRRGEIELILGMIHEPDNEFAALPLKEDIVVVAAGHAHPIFKKQNPKIADLAKYGWVLPVPQVDSRRWLDATFEKHDLPPPHAQIEANSTPMPQHMIASAQLLCFVSRHTLSRGSDSPLREVPIEATTMRRLAGLTYHGAHRAPPVQRVVDLMSAHLDWIGGGATVQ